MRSTVKKIKDEPKISDRRLFSATTEPGGARRRLILPNGNRQYKSPCPLPVSLRCAAFQHDRIDRYSRVAGLPVELIEEVSSRLPGAARSIAANDSAAAHTIQGIIDTVRNFYLKIAAIRRELKAKPKDAYYPLPNWFFAQSTRLG